MRLCIQREKKEQSLPTPKLRCLIKEKVTRTRTASRTYASEREDEANLTLSGGDETFRPGGEKHLKNKKTRKSGRGRARSGAETTIRLGFLKKNGKRERKGTNQEE